MPIGNLAEASLQIRFLLPDASSLYQIDKTKQKSKQRKWKKQNQKTLVCCIQHAVGKETLLGAAACMELEAMGLHGCAQKEKHVITLLTYRAFDFFFQTEKVVYYVAEN